MSSLVLLVLGQCLSLGPSWQEARVPVPPCPGTAPQTSRDSPGACGIQACSQRSDGCGQTGSNSASAEGLGWGPSGALGRGDPAPVVSRWLRLGWAVQQHWGAPWVVLTGLFLLRVWSAVVSGAHWDLWSLLCPTEPRGTGTGSVGTLLEEADVPPRSPALWGCTCCLASARRNACAGKESAWELSGDFPGRAGIWEFSALPLLPSFLTHTLLSGSQTALKKATAHTMLFPSPAGAGDEIPHPVQGIRN